MKARRCRQFHVESHLRRYASSGNGLTSGGIPRVAWPLLPEGYIAITMPRGIFHVMSVSTGDFDIHHMSTFSALPGTPEPWDAVLVESK